MVEGMATSGSRYDRVAREQIGANGTADFHLVICA